MLQKQYSLENNRLVFRSCCIYKRERRAERKQSLARKVLRFKHSVQQKMCTLSRTESEHGGGKEQTTSCTCSMLSCISTYPLLLYGVLG